MHDGLKVTAQEVIIPEKVSKDFWNTDTNLFLIVSVISLPSSNPASDHL